MAYAYVVEGCDPDKVAERVHGLPEVEPESAAPAPRRGLV
jgi:hypothetical protein